MALRVPVIEVLNEALAVRLGRVILGVIQFRTAEETPARRPASQSIGVVDRVPDLVPQDAETRLGIAPFDFEHVGQLEPGEPRDAQDRTERRCPARRQE